MWIFTVACGISLECEENKNRIFHETVLHANSFGMALPRSKGTILFSILDWY